MQVAASAPSRRRDGHHVAARAGVAVAVLVAAGLLIAACGGGSPAPGVANLKRTTTTSGTGSAGRSAQALRFAACMRSHGVSAFPDPTPGTSSFPHVSGIDKAPGFASAESACRRYLPTAPSGAGFSAAQIDHMQTDALAMARCLRSHGVKSFPDPKYTALPGGNFEVTFAKSTCKLDESTPAFLAAVKACPSGLGGNFALAFIRAQQQYGAACAH
jgi:hypothetical protein